VQSIDITRAGLLRQQLYLDATAHNIANASTNGFKLARPLFESGDVAPPADAATGGASAPELSATVPIGRLFTQGALRQTGVPTDVAIEGPGFIAVQRTDGSTGYTRDGALGLDQTGRLVDGAGRPVQPAIVVPAGADHLHIAADGTVSVQVAGGTQALGRTQLATFVNPGGLLAAGDGLFSATAASGAATVANPGEAGTGAVHQGALEQSNADLTEQMANLVSAQRAYGLNATAFGIGQQLLQLANQMQGGG
jgi:flagellar basal-body rod protein FlgG